MMYFGGISAAYPNDPVHGLLSSHAMEKKTRDGLWIDDSPRWTSLNQVMIFFLAAIKNNMENYVCVLFTVL